MFNPNFNYTHRIVKNLVDIASAREIILNAYLMRKWEISLRRDAIIRAAHASTAIEGNPLTLEEVSQLAQGRKITATRKAQQEVLNYLRVLEDIEKYHEKGRINDKIILKLHKDITKNTLENPEYEGRYRELQVYVGNRITGEVIFMPPSPEKVPALMSEFEEWLNSNDSSQLNPVLIAGISHYEFVRIHPFVDGNGRTGRALATLLLSLREFDIKKFFALDDYYDSDRMAYYRALNSVDQKTLDLTGWIEYFTDGVLLSITKVKEKVLQLSLEKYKKKAKGQVALTEKQTKIIEHIISNGRITSGEIQKMFKISRPAAYKEIKKLIELDLIEPKGTGRAIYYVIK
ncbi:MAG: Fic family protein [Candidatus Methanoperedens sp.]|nr:Fic family protein [Candidatus Methanoperedens sp.]